MILEKKNQTVSFALTYLPNIVPTLKENAPAFFLKGQNKNNVSTYQRKKDTYLKSHITNNFEILKSDRNVLLKTI